MKIIKRITPILALFIMCFSPILAEKQAIESHQLFDSGWKFILSDKPEYQKSDFNDTDWRTLDLPHDWSIEGKPEKANPTSGAGGYFPAGTGWYRKHLNVPTDWAGKRISLCFEGVYMNATVFVNGVEAASHPYGYTSFQVDVTDKLTFGNENTVAVRVDNSQQLNCRWYSGSGIYRHVWLNVTNPVHVDHWGVTVTTPEVSNEKATVLIKTKVKNETAQSQKISLRTTLKGIPNAVSVQPETEIPAFGETVISQTIIVEHPALWSPEKPDLYQAMVEIKQGKTTLDKMTQSFGIRTIEYSSEKGFLLNGKSIKLNGGCLHHDHGCLGAASYDRAEERKVELLKAAGFNAVRTSHNPPAEAFLDACDRLGLLVIDEAFDGWRTEKNPYDYARIFDKWAKTDIQSMVLRDRNHPSVIMWSIGNEIIERTSPEAVQTARFLASAIKEVDNTRPVTSAMTTWNQGWSVFDSLMAEHDICGYNYTLQESGKDHQRVPSRVIVQTESYPREAFKNWQAVQNQPWVIGDFVWTALDYLGESGIGRWFYPGETKGEHWEADLFPWHGAYCGDIDLTGWRKPISHYRNILWNDTEKLYMAVREPNPANGKIRETMWSVWPTWESWTWPGMEGKPLEVEVYSKYPLVRLYLNNQLIAEKNIGIADEFKAVFPVNYTAGELKVVAFQNDKLMETKILKTASEAFQLRLTPDRKVIRANGQDLSFVTVEVLDKNEILQPNAEIPLQFSITGQGVIAGVDNANLQDTDSYVSTTRNTWKGRAMVVVKNTHKAGKICLKVQASGLKTSEIHMNAK